MPRKPRVVAAGVPHHVTQRGNNRQEIFLIDEDRRFYLAALGANSQRYGVRVVGYNSALKGLRPLFVPWPSPTGLPLLLTDAAEVSRFSCRKFPDVRGVYRPRRAERGLALSPPPVLPSASEHSVGAPEELFHGSIPSPSVPLSNASPAMSPPSAHDSMSGWFATPFLWALASPTLCRFIPALSGCPDFFPDFLYPLVLPLDAKAFRA